MKRYIFLCQDGAIQDVGLLDGDRLSITIEKPFPAEPGIHRLVAKVLLTCLRRDAYSSDANAFTLCRGEVHTLRVLQALVFAAIDKERHTAHVPVNIMDLLRSPAPVQLQLGV